MNTFHINLSYPHNGTRAQYVEAMDDIIKNRKEILNLITCQCSVSEIETTLIISGQRIDVLAWFDIVMQDYPILETEFMAIKRLMRFMFVQHKVDKMGDYHVVLGDVIERYISPTGLLVRKDWFRKSVCETAEVFTGKKINE